MKTTLHNRIMRRIYFAFAKRIVTHPITTQIGVFVLALIIFAKLVHVRSVLENMMATQVGNLPSFVLGAVTHGEVLTLIAVGVMTFVMLSLPLQIRAQFVPRMRTV